MDDIAWIIAYLKDKNLNASSNACVGFYAAIEVLR